MIPGVEIGLHHQIDVVVSCPVHRLFPDETEKEAKSTQWQTRGGIYQVHINGMQIGCITIIMIW